MHAFDDEIDGLYRGPLATFTDQRNALATRAGGDMGKAIRALVKPPLAAWAVNQVYWRDRIAFDRLITAAEAVRAAHRRLVSGEAADVAAAEAAHAEALALAMDVARAALAESPTPASPAVLAAVAGTLRALPSADPVGRLTRPLTPVSGFEAFAGITALPPRAAPRDRMPPLRLQKGAETVKADAREAARERARVARDVAAASATLREAEAALEAHTRALEAAVRERDRRQAALDEAAARLHDLTVQRPRVQQAVEQAAHERDRLARRRDALDA
ncbi:MAG: hypothetical protein Q8L86_07570 [Vicinamibacterales bacterium]|nr:hypothetical protein [Vicinamibacterales bacterium]